MHKPLKDSGRRNFLRSLSLFGGLIVAKNSVFGGNGSKLAAEGFSVVAGPYLQTDFDNEMCIQWITQSDAHGWVLYGTDPGALELKAAGNPELGLLPLGRIHRVTLRDLTPGATYYYRVVSKEVLDFQPYKLSYGTTLTSEVFQFVNQDIAKSEVSFIVLNDLHERHGAIERMIGLDDVESRDFVFFNGDMFDYQIDEQQLINVLLRPISKTFATRIPLHYVRGNHETRGVFARSIDRYFKQIGYTAFTLGPVRFIVLDTGEDKVDEHPVYAGIVDFDGYRAEQAQWLKQEIQCSEFTNAAFRVVLMHIPPFYSGDEHGSAHCSQLFNPLFNQGKVDIVISGHTHTHKIHKARPEIHAYPIVIGGGPQDGSRTLMRVHIDEQRLSLEVVDDRGDRLATYQVDRR
ncbi:purple acid phosphatase family protein [Sphingobacterium griseoflavum]|uniref:Metallophosphoesterase n=1 Tax=Sphingobacterium griseoflavum TaxID=1474952 RepID=A0ABQ3HXV7_9SPHI|nr:metallophosphoesterase family protein [Sphingobacterium griseoflavum]GHE45589.1 hypothetical protein GCM10017764_31040 [Sphingobacterium griseoflavum]